MAMRKIVFFCIPAHGHTNPTLPLVQELVRQGHAVFYYSFLPFREKIEAAGATFIGCDEMDIGVNDKDGNEKVGKDIVFSTRLIVGATLALDEKITTELTALQPDIIVGDSVAYWGKLAAMKLSIPFVSSTTTFAFNQHSSKIMKQSLWDLLKMLWQLPRTKRILAPLRALGYPAENILSIVQNDNDTRTIVYTSPLFQPCSETFSDKYAFVGPCITDTQEVFEKRAETLVYISMGTVDNKRAEFYQNCIRAFAHSGYDVVMSVGETVIASAGNVRVYPFVNQIAVLKQADVFLSHCGMNSVSESLYFGVPLVLAPQTPEQGAVATRTQQVGAGLLLENIQPDTILTAVQTVLSNHSYREHAKAVAASFAACGGAKLAAETILEQ